jgi:hypothetical protein
MAEGRSQMKRTSQRFDGICQFQRHKADHIISHVSLNLRFVLGRKVRFRSFERLPLLWIQVANHPIVFIGASEFRIALDSLQQ